MAESGFNFQKFIDDSKATLLKPKEYFASMAKEGGFGEPIIKALIYGVVAGIISFIWSLLNLSPGAAFMFGGAGGIMVIIGAIIFAIIGLFIGGIIVLIISAICGGSTNFETNVRVTASLMVLSPVNAVLSIFTGLSITLGAFISLIVSLYGLYLLFNALVGALGAKEGTSKVVTIILAIIPILMLISSLMCASAVSNMTGKSMENMMENSEEMKELQEKLMKMAEEGANE